MAGAAIAWIRKVVIKYCKGGGVNRACTDNFDRIPDDVSGLDCKAVTVAIHISIHQLSVFLFLRD